MSSRHPFRPQYQGGGGRGGGRGGASTVPIASYKSRFSAPRDGPYNFSWLIVNEIAGCAVPKSQEQLDWLAKQGIRNIVTVTKSDLPPSSCKDSFRHLLLPVPNFSSPSQEHIRAFLRLCQEAREKGEIAFHGAVDADAAIRTVRERRPGSIEVREQEEAVIEFYNSFKKQHQRL